MPPIATALMHAWSKAMWIKTLGELVLAWFSSTSTAFPINWIDLVIHIEFKETLLVTSKVGLRPDEICGPDPLSYQY